MTTTVDSLRAVLDRLEDAGIELEYVDLHWFKASDERAQQIVGLFPDREWSAHGSPSSEWVASGRESGVEITAFLEAPKPVPQVRAAHIIESARAEAVSA